MSEQFCTGCGASLPAGSQFCAYCGRPVAVAGMESVAPTLAGSAPLGAPSAPTSIPTPPAAPPARRRRRWVRIVVVIVVVVIVVVAAIAVYGYYTSVDVTALNIYAPDNVCDLNVYLIGYTGFNSTTGSSFPLSLLVPNNNTTSCTLRAVTTNTSGFGVEDVQLPGPIPGNTTGVLSSGTLNLTLTLPGGRYSGVVNLVFS